MHSKSHTHGKNSKNKNSKNKNSKNMELIRKQLAHGLTRYLILTDKDLKTGADRAVIADPRAQTVQRVPDLPKLLRSEDWRALTSNDLTLDELVRQMPALRRFRGIEIRLPSGAAAWICWRRWECPDPDALALLTETTAAASIPAYEPDGDHFLAAHAVEVLGGEVLDPPRSAYASGSESY